MVGLIFDTQLQHLYLPSFGSDSLKEQDQKSTRCDFAKPNTAKPYTAKPDTANS